MDGGQPVDALARLLRRQSRVRPSLSWEEAERALGVTFPDDYRKLVSLFGSGVFDSYVRVVSPVEHEMTKAQFILDFEGTLDRVREWSAQGTVPYRIFPEPGGVIPWAECGDGVSLFWRTDQGGPDDWTVVWCDDAFSTWEEYAGSTSEFLLDLLTGQVRSELLVFEPVDDPVFFPDPPDPPELSTPEVAEEINPLLWRHILGPLSAAGPTDLVDGLVALTGIGRSEQVSHWKRVERELGVVLPADYKALVDRFGPGDFLGIRVVTPDAEQADFGLPGLVDDVQALVGERRPLPGAPFFPEPGGLIPWGSTAAGHLFCWAPFGEEPDNWPVVMLYPGFGAQGEFTRSMSSLLLAYLSRTGGDIGMLPDPAEFGYPDRPLFIPGR